MKAATLDPATPLTGRLADYFALAKPRVAVLVLFTVGAGVLLASAPAVPLGILFHAVFGTALVATGASALNQWLERESDGAMRRTRERPLPAGRLSPMEVLAFGIGCGVAGTLYLLLTLASPLAAGVSAFTFFAYVFVYTPLKRLTTLNTLIGAVPGALPPVIGWCAVRGEITAEAWALFVILFLWQVPHFLAIAWIYREEYARAGLCMLPSLDPEGALTSRQMVLYCLALVCASLGPALLGTVSGFYVAGALILGLYFTASAMRFSADRTTTRARRVLRASLVYLPGLLLVLILDRSLNLILG